MRRFTSSIRKPVKRQGAEQYLLITLMSFAGSVTLTRLFLELTGYPQLGGGALHIAHVLWGGLLLFFAALLPLLFANRWVYTLGALLGGIGVGLFIDEVGKFITATNDYFYPLAAPIIYAFFLLTVLLYLQVRRPVRGEARSELYRVFDAMEEVLEHDLDAAERAELEQRLSYIAQQQDQPVLAHVAKELLEVIHYEAMELAPPRSTLWQRLSAAWERFEDRRVSPLRVKAVLAGGLLALSLMALTNMIAALPLGPEPGSLERLIEQLVQSGQLSGGSGWLAARLALETSVGLLMLVSAGLYIAGKDNYANGLSYLGLLLSLTTVNLLVFYFDQFSTITTALVQFGLLLTTAYYRQKYLNKNK